MYDPKFKQVKWRHDNDWTVASLCAMSETVVPEYSVGWNFVAVIYVAEL